MNKPTINQFLNNFEVSDLVNIRSKSSKKNTRKKIILPKNYLISHPSVQENIIIYRKDNGLQIQFIDLFKNDIYHDFLSKKQSKELKKLEKIIKLSVLKYKPRKKVNAFYIPYLHDQKDKFFFNINYAKLVKIDS